VSGGGWFQLVPPENVPHESLGAVSLDRTAELLRSDDAQPGNRELIRAQEHGHEPAVHTASLVENRPEFWLPPQPFPWPQALIHSPGACCHGFLPARAGPVRVVTLGRGDGQALAALRPAPFQHVPPVLGGHAHEKTVGTTAAATVRLERPFHGLARFSGVSLEGLKKP